MFKAAGRFFGAIFSFLLSILIALFVLFAVGYVIQVLLGNETSSEYLKRYTDFYHNPGETPLGRWAVEAYERIRR